MIYQDLKSGSSFYKTVQSALNNDLIPFGIGEIVFFKNPTPNTEPPAALSAIKNALVSSIVSLHHYNVVPLYHTFFLTFFFYIYVIERRNVHVMQRHNVVIGTIIK